MKKFGTFLAIFGALLILFDVAGCENNSPSPATDWMENWGNGTGLLIKIAMFVAGIILIAVSDRKTT